jgi:hypothetical protein
MTVAMLRRVVTKLESLAGNRARANAALLEELRRHPEQIMLRAGMTPDAWQQDLLRGDESQVMILASRQIGKTAVAAALALKTALLQPRSPVLLLSPSLRQSGELFRGVRDLFNALGRPMGIVSETTMRLELSNGSRLISLPGTENTVRCFSRVAMLIIDEAARVGDPLYYAVRPMLAVSQGRLVALSTPFGKRGWFHDSWHSEESWRRVRIMARDCARITPQFLATERKAMGDRWFRQEYECDFSECIDAVFSYEDIRNAMSDEVKPLFAAP